MHFMQYVITMMLSCQLKGDRVPRAGDKATPGRHAAGRGSSRYSLMNLAVKLLQEQTNPTAPEPRGMGQSKIRTSTLYWLKFRQYVPTLILFAVNVHKYIHLCCYLISIVMALHGCC